MTRIINRQPSRYGRLVLGLLPFIIVLVLYIAASDPRLTENPNDKLLPSLGIVVVVAGHDMYGCPYHVN